MRVAMGVAVLLFGAGCKNVAPDTDQAAIIVAPDTASRAALQAAVNAALHTDVLLADDALTSNDLLIIEQRAPQSMQNNPAQGRNMQLPVQFKLVKNGDDCVLIDQRDQSRTALADTQCIVK